MKTHFIIESDAVSKLVAELCALTGESNARAVTTALRERLTRVRDARSRQAATDPAAILARACAVSRGPGIPLHHNWGDGE